MYMGEIKPKIHRLNSTDYESKIVLAACVLDTMRFRVEFMDNNKPIGFYFDFELKMKNIILFIVIVAIILGVIFLLKIIKILMILS